ncbi:protein acetyllysine N-acetyltransferase [Plasmodiophora brassicae]
MTSYAAKLIQKRDKGLCGDPERVDDDGVVRAQVAELARLVRSSRHCIVHTGAGISTSAGVHDFRGPDGVWTRQQRKLPPLHGVAFGDAVPTITHMAIVALVRAGLVKHVVSQNVDGLHVRSGLPRQHLCEVHGTAFAEWCDQCQCEFRRADEVATIGLRPTGNACKRCGGPLRDLLCDWDSNLPQDEVEYAIEQHRMADLAICVGTSLRIRPAGLWPLRTIRLNGKKEPGRICVINLQKTHLDRRCAVRIFARCDHVFTMLMDELGVDIPKWVPVECPYAKLGWRPTDRNPSADVADRHAGDDDAGSTGSSAAPTEDGKSDDDSGYTPDR